MKSVKIVFDDEVKALLLLSSLPNSWNGLVVSVSNSSESLVLKFDDVAGFILREEARRISLGEDSSFGLVLNAEERGRKLNRGKNKNWKNRSKSRKGRS